MELKSSQTWPIPMSSVADAVRPKMSKVTGAPKGATSALRSWMLRRTALRGVSPRRRAGKMAVARRSRGSSGILT